MKNSIAWILCVCIVALITNSCGLFNIYNIDEDGIPRFVNVNYIELSSIEKISRFRSASGHDYSDDFESCRSMKHYFQPYDSLEWNHINITSPIKGEISNIREEWAGTQLLIRSDEYPAFEFIIFHIDTDQEYSVGDKIEEGQNLGTHIGSQTTSDIAVGVKTPGGYKLVSYFDCMSDSLFAFYQLRGVLSRADLIISKEDRDNDPLTCNFEYFTNSGSIENWVELDDE